MVATAILAGGSPRTVGLAGIAVREEIFELTK